MVTDIREKKECITMWRLYPFYFVHCAKMLLALAMGLLVSPVSAVIVGQRAFTANLHLERNLATTGAGLTPGKQDHLLVCSV